MQELVTSTNTVYTVTPLYKDSSGFLLHAQSLLYGATV